MKFHWPQKLQLLLINGKKLLHGKKKVILVLGQDQQQHPAVHTRGVIRARGGSVAEDILKVDFFAWSKL